jgi:hypothetical protein
MSLLTEAQYEEYIALLRAWVDAEKALDGPGEPDTDAARQAREAYAAVESFRDRFGLMRGPDSPEVAAGVHSRWGEGRAR